MRKYLDKFSEWLCGFNIEPYLHILVTIVLAAIIARVCYLTGADRVLAGCVGGFLAFILGYLKEVWDNKVEKVFEGKDILANFIGAILFFFIWI